jgi:hypothetical protein
MSSNPHNPTSIHIERKDALATALDYLLSLPDDPENEKPGAASLSADAPGTSVDYPTQMETTT